MPPGAKRWLAVSLSIIFLILLAFLGGGSSALPVLFVVAILFIPLWLVWRFTPAATTDRRLTWNQCLVIILGTAIFGNSLLAAWPFWLAPPRLALTAGVYLVLAGAWFPVTFICLLLRPRGTGSVAAIFLIVILGSVMCIISLALAGPNVADLAYGATDCQLEITATGQNRYTCKPVSSSDMPSYNDVVVFEGPTWLPFVRLVSRQH